MNIRIYGKDARLRFCASFLEKYQLRGVKEIMLLPVPSSKDGVSVFGTEEPLSELCRTAGEGTLTVGYGIPKEFAVALFEKGAEVIDLEEDEIYLSENARLTAVGTVGRLLTSEGRAPCRLSVGIIGYGRIGAFLLRYLMFLGAEVRVFTSRRSALLELLRAGVDARDTSWLEQLDGDGKAENPLRGLNVLINTAPAKILRSSSAGLLEGVRVIELASGNNLPKEIDCERFASVPCVMYPESAGYVMCSAIIRRTEKTETEDEDVGGDRP